MAEHEHSDYEVQLKAANEAVYKQSAELAIKNKTLELLGKLYDISVRALAQKDQAVRVAQTIQGEFDFPIVALLRYNNISDTLESLAVAASQKVRESEQQQGMALDGVYIRTAAQDPFFKPILRDRTMEYTEDLASIWRDDHCRGVCESLATTDLVRSTLGYPLIANENVIGVLILSLNRKYEDLIDYEKTALQNVINVIATTLDKVILYEQLAVANRQQESLLHFISHEVKGALGKCAGIMSLILEGDYGPAPEKMTAAVSNGLAHTREATDMLSTILLSASLKSGAIKFDIRPFSLKQAVQTILSSLKPDADAKHLELAYSAPEGDCMITGDENMLATHVIRNLVDNAIRYTPKGSIHIQLVEKPDSFVLSVKDSGVGLTEEDKALLFTAGGRGKDSVKVNVASTGYGLFFTKQIIETHKGTISAESEGKDKGSTFTVMLPRATM